jgi:hypothetical protein
MDLTLAPAHTARAVIDPAAGNRGGTDGPASC